MTINEALIATQVCIKADLPAMIWGQPGVGKSDMLRLLPKLLGMQLLPHGDGTVRVNLMDQVDMRGGIPYLTPDKNTRWGKPAFCPSEGRYLIVLEELVTAQPAIQSAMYQFVLDRAAGEHKLSPDARIVATGNYAKDAASTYPMPTPLRTRFVHLNVAPNVDSFKSWLMGQEMQVPVLNMEHKRRRSCDELLAFFEWRGANRAAEQEDGLLYAFDSRAQTFACPRSWASASRLVDAWRGEAAVTVEIQQELLSGCVGQGAATEFLGFLRLMDKALPSLDKIIKDPETAKIHTDISTRYAVWAALLGRVTRETQEAIFTYFHRMGTEFTVSGLLICENRQIPDFAFYKLAKKFDLAGKVLDTTDWGKK